MTTDPIHRLPINAVHNLGAVIVASLAPLLATPFIVQRLGDERFGVYLLALSVAGIGGLLDMGLTPASIKFVAECRARGDDRELSLLINSLVLTRVPLALLAAGAGFIGGRWVCEAVLVVSPQLLSEAVFVVKASMLTLAVSLIAGTFAALPRAVHRFDLASRLATSLGLALTGATVAALALGFGLRAIAVVEVVLHVLYLAASVAVARKLVPAWQIDMRLDLDWCRRLARFGALIALNTLTGFIYLHLNRILLGRALGPAAVPYLAIPWGLSARVAQVVNALTEAITPVASELAAGHAADTLRGLYSRSMRIATIAALTLVVPIVVSAPDLLALWLGPEFSARADTVLRILAVSAGFQSLGAVPYFILNGVGRPAAANLAPVAGAGLNLALTLVLLRSRGPEGVAIAILSGIVTQTLILILCLDRALELRGGATRAFLGPLALAVVAAAMSVHVGDGLADAALRLFIRCTSALVVFHALLLVAGSYGRREIDLARRTLFGGKRPDAREPDA